MYTHTRARRDASRALFRSVMESQKQSRDEDDDDDDDDDEEDWLFQFDDESDDDDESEWRRSWTKKEGLTCV